ncbi:class I SAM-dependent methyltransferase [Geodermatophilus sp. DSM 44513]|uniref:class I SAM-dependent methyltransferase n=1 Tax=Geodermatophilus sp. DSM 44513 TaxID=1528104 RepID=UPI0012834CD3|nr:class I SAM-dependent methyltransferase [Geodermatophilus sp. DSM 44513]WNV73734.1 class I SAM-dependent methyltransferase [Geodermatophilus sp. DSM 44513]
MSWPAGTPEAFALVRAGYDRIGPRYRDGSRDNAVRLHFVQTLLDRLGPGSVVVDLGCGSGEPATRVLAGHHRVVGVDGSLGQLRLARSAAPTAALVQADMTRLALRPGSVDAVASFYALGHVPAAEHAHLFASIASWLRPGGILLTSAPVVAGDGRQEDWLGVPMFFGGIGPEATRQAVEAAGLEVEGWETVAEDEGDGRTVSFLWITARRATGERRGPGR